MFLLLFLIQIENLKVGKLEKARGEQTLFWVSQIPALHLLLAIYCK